MRLSVARTTPFSFNSILSESGFTQNFLRAISSSFCSSSGSNGSFVSSSFTSLSSSSEKEDLETIRRRNFPIRTVHVFEKQQQQRRKKTRMSSKTEEKEESNIIPVTVFVNQKLMDSKPIERLRGMKFDRLKIECVSDDNDGGDDDDDTADNALGEKEKLSLIHI